MFSTITLTISLIISFLSIMFFFCYIRLYRKEILLMVETLDDLIAEADKQVKKADNDLDREVATAYKRAFKETRKLLIGRL